MTNNIFKNVILETDRLILRNFVKEDKDDFYEKWIQKNGGRLYRGYI
jgi:hypothetical protein